MTDQIKEPELPVAYYTHKRSALLASAALLALCLAKGGELPKVAFEGVSLAIGGDTALFILAIAAIYYTVLFWIMWRTDGPAYARAKAGTHPQLEQDIAKGVGALQDASKRADDAVKILQFTGEKVTLQEFMRQLTDALGPERVRDLILDEGRSRFDGVTARQALEKQLQLFGDDLGPTQIEQVGAVFEQTLQKELDTAIRMLLAAGHQRDDRWTRPIFQMHDTTADAIPLLGALKAEIIAAATGIGRISSTLLKEQRFLQVRLVAFDLAPCVALLVLALLHYVGIAHPIIPLTVADLPRLLMLTR